MLNSQNLTASQKVAQKLHQIVEAFDSYTLAHALITQARLYKPVRNGKISFSSTDLIVQLVYTFKNFKNELVELVEPVELFETDETDEPVLLPFHDESLKEKLIKTIAPDDVETLPELEELIKSDYMMAWWWSALCRFIREIIKSVSSKAYNPMLEPEKLYLLFAIHQIFEGFKAAHYDFLHELINDVEAVEFVDVETIPYHKRIHPVVPHGVKLAQLIKNFMTSTADPYTHKVLNMQRIKAFPIFNFRVPKVCLNLLNDIGFYIRFYPSCNLQALLSKESKDSTGPEFNIHTLGLTKQAVLKRYNLV